MEEVIERGHEAGKAARDLEIGSPERFRSWVIQARVDRDVEQGPTADEVAEIEKLRKEVAHQQ